MYRDRSVSGYGVRGAGSCLICAKALLLMTNRSKFVATLKTVYYLHIMGTP